MDEAIEQPPRSLGLPANGLPTKKDRCIAALIWIAGLVFGFIPGLFLYFLLRRTPGWLLEQAREALNIELTLMFYCITYSVGSYAISYVLVGFLLFFIPVILICLILHFVLGIMGTAKACKGEVYRGWLRPRFIK